MSYVLEKHFIKRYEITKVWVNFMLYKSFSRVRNDKPNCELCEKKFEPQDNTNLAFIKGEQNHLICDKCANEAIENGAEKTEVNKNK